MEKITHAGDTRYATAAMTTDAGFRAHVLPHVLLRIFARSSACRTRSRSSNSSRNWASRSASISVKILSRTSARDDRFELRLIFALSKLNNTALVKR